MMQRRQFLGAALAAPTRIQYHDYSRCLPDFLKSLAQQAYERRRREIEGITTAAGVEKRRQWARETFWRLIGGPLEKTPLKPKTVGSFEREGYRVDKVLYESRPELFIAANLYIPTTGKPPYPGVLFQMGHTLNGKAGGTYQACCQGLARLGFVVLAFDPMGQGERTYYPRTNGVLTRLPSADDEHTVPGKQLLLVGDSSTRFQVWDSIRSLDYLASLPMVDPTKLASTGQSGGGTTTMLLAAADDRLACAAVCSGNTENLICANFNPPGSTDDAEQNFINGGVAGFDRWDTLYPLAPKPLLLLVSAKDSFGTYSPRYLDNGREEYAHLQSIYNVMGKREQLAWYESPLPHGMSYDLRMEVYRWFRRWLQGNTAPLDQEPMVKPEPDQTLYCTPSGNAARDLGSKTPVGVARDDGRSIRNPSGAPALDRLLSMNPLPASIPLTVVGRTESRQVDIEATEVASAPGVWTPAWTFRPKTGSGNTPCVIILEPNGRNSRWNEESLYQELARSGVYVVAPDLRGIGDMAPEYPRQAFRHATSHQREEAFAWASLMLGKPLLGQRVTDLRAYIRALGTRRPITIAATGKMTIPALMAAAMEPAVTSVYLAQHLVSYRMVLDTEEYTVPLANFAWDLLRHTDLPQVAAAAAPRKVKIAGPVDARGQAVELDAARQLYASANVQVVAAEPWTAEALKPA